MNLQQLLQEAVDHHRAGRLQAAQAAYAQLLTQDPQNVDALHLMGVLFHQAGHHAQAVELIGRAVARAGDAPAAAPMHYNLGEAQRAAGRSADALESFKHAIRLQPDFAEAHSNIALLLNDLSKYDDAAIAARRAIQLKPNFPHAHNNLAVALARLGQVDEAIASASTAIRLNPNFADAHNTLGICYGWRGQGEQAITSFRRAIQLDPNNAEAYANLGVALAKSDRLKDAADALRKAVQLRPDRANAWENLAGVYKRLGQRDDEVACWERLTQLIPESANAWTNLGILREQQHGRLDDADRALQQALRIEPENVAALGTLGIVRMKNGLHDDALHFMRRSLELSGNVKLHTNLCMLANYHPALDSAAVLEIHRQWERDYAQPAPSIGLHRNDRTRDRVLRIGYVSPDFKAHASRHFIEAMLIAHDRAGFHVTCYANVIKPDAVTEELRKRADAWRDIVGQSDADVAAMVRDDRIDILVDLAGQTADTRLTLFAMRPSPVQVSMVGYPSTTGLTSIDYKISDAVVDPPGAERFYSETLLRLDGTFWCFHAAPDTPDVNALPAIANGYITFGSANNVAKITPSALELWARIVAAVPNSRMRMQHSGLASPSVQQRVRDVFARHGVSDDRLFLSDWMRFADYLDLLRTFDIALDTFPFNGGTTTCQQLYLGVPCITLAGDRQVSRMGVTMLHALGLDELIAESFPDYLAKAVALANDLDRLEQIRLSLRERMMQSPLGDARTYTAQLEAAYRTIWTEWCGRTS